MAHTCAWIARTSDWRGRSPNREVRRTRGTSVNLSNREVHLRAEIGFSPLTANIADDSLYSEHWIRAHAKLTTDGITCRSKVSYKELIDDGNSPPPPVGIGEQVPSDHGNA
jgi:hypothetical protein